MPIFDNVIILNPENLTIADSARVDSFTKIECAGGVSIGEYVHIASFVHVLGGGPVVFEDYSAAASGAKVISGSNDIAALSCSAVAPASMQLKKHWPVTIHRYAILFAGAIVMADVGEGAVIAAGAVLTKAAEPWGIYAGVPARKIGVRNKELKHEDPVAF